MDHTPADDLRVELGRAQSERDFYRKLVELGAQDALEAQVAERRFREDLYYRLHGFTIHVPSLDERREDIPELMEFFCARACEADGIPICACPPPRSAPPRPPSGPATCASSPPACARPCCGRTTRAPR